MLSNQEYVLTDTDSIVSKTDLKGIITYVNNDFVRISGFSREELLGHPHNIIRHPDMPKSVFADMWETLKNGNSWSGVIKNRNKNGQFYWVQMNSMPLLENGKVTGYMSVRSKTTSDEIRFAETLYRNLNTGNSKIRFDAGEIVYSGLINSIKRTFRDISVKAKLSTLVATSILSIGLIAFYGSYGLSITNNVMGYNMNEIETHAKGIALSRDAQLEFKSQLQEFDEALLHSESPEAFAKSVKSFDAHSEKIAQNLRALNDSMSEMPEKDMVDSVVALSKNYSVFVEKYRIALKSYQIGNAENLADIDFMLNGLDKPLANELAKIVAFHQTEIDKHINDSQTILKSIAHQFEINTALIGTGIATFLLIWSILTASGIIERLNRAAKLIADLSEGKKIEVNAYSKNELGKMMRAIKMLSIKSGFEAAEDRRASNEIRRIKLALDEVRLAVTLANSQNQFIYMNTASKMLWETMKPEMIKRFPNFTIESMYGQSLGRYFEKEKDRELFEIHSKEPKHLFVNLGGKRFRLTVISIYDDRGLYAGRMTQWKDITLELAMEQQISRIVEAATSGNFKNRVNIAEKQGFFRDLADGLNLLLESCDKSYSDIADIFAALSRGDLTHSIKNQYIGEFETIKNNANHTVQKLTEIVEQIKQITDNVNNSSSETAISSSNLADRTHEQATAIELTAASMQVLTSTVTANTENARKANDFVISASDIASKGVNVIHRVVSTMEDIHEASRKVVDIISVIDSISFQTNILALNAAVEAARAGEQGRGFAVVASEVRNLAQRAATAAGEIKTLINDSVDKIEDGSKLVLDAGHTMEEIVSSIQTATQMIGQVSAASQEQNAGILQANNSITEMEEMTQQNAILVEQSATISDSLKSQAADLLEAVDYFKLS